MMVVLAVVMIFVMVAVVFLLGFCLGGDHTESEVARVQLEAAQASRQLHNLTRDAFVAMAEAAEQRRAAS